MKKKDLINAIAEKSGLTKTDTEKAFNATLDVFEETLLNEESIQLVGFGTFKTVERKERKGVNPATKQPMVIPAYKTVTFKISKSLKETLNKK